MLEFFAYDFGSPLTIIDKNGSYSQYPDYAPVGITTYLSHKQHELFDRQTFAEIKPDASPFLRLLLHFPVSLRVKSTPAPIDGGCSMIDSLTVFFRKQQYSINKSETSHHECSGQPLHVTNLECIAHHSRWRSRSKWF